MEFSMSMLPTQQDKVKSVIRDLDLVSQMLHMVAGHEWDYEDCNTALCIENRNKVKRHWDVVNKGLWN